jgi:hypothetical protein
MEGAEGELTLAAGRTSALGEEASSGGGGEGGGEGVDSAQEDEGILGGVGVDQVGVQEGEGGTLARGEEVRGEAAEAGLGGVHKEGAPHTAVVGTRGVGETEGGALEDEAEGSVNWSLRNERDMDSLNVLRYQLALPRK